MHVPATIRRHVWISGWVQGVWFRDSCRREAASRGVAGWVRNSPDGRVEAVFQGPEPVVTEMVDWCRHGPPRAQVTGVELAAEAVSVERGFQVR